MFGKEFTLGNIERLVSGDVALPDESRAAAEARRPPPSRHERALPSVMIETAAARRRREEGEAHSSTIIIPRAPMFAGRSGLLNLIVSVAALAMATVCLLFVLVSSGSTSEARSVAAKGPSQPAPSAGLPPKPSSPKTRGRAP